MKQSQSQTANSGETGKSDEAIPQPTGREGKADADRNKLAADDFEEAPATQPTEAHHDVGSGEEETADGLDPETEFVRRAAEEGALDAPDSDDVPVFDRAERI
jgi:hypothetical protein